MSQLNKKKKRKEFIEKFKTLNLSKGQNMNKLNKHDFFFFFINTRPIKIMTLRINICVQ